MEKIHLIKHEICFIGGSKQIEMRSKILLDGMRKNGIKITQIVIKYANARGVLKMKNSENPYGWNYHFKFWRHLLPRIAYENINVFFALLRNITTIKTSKFLFLSEYSNYIIFTVKIFAFFYQKPIIFDAHGSLYYQRIIGTEDYPENSLYAQILFYTDKLSAICVDKYITLSASYAQILSSDFCLRKEKFIPIYLGYTEIGQQKKCSDKNIDIIQLSGGQLFHGIGKTIDLVYLLANKKKNIKTLLTGSVEYEHKIKALKLEKNIESRRINQDEKNDYIASAKIILGPMGESKLNKIDFSTKMNEALAYGKVLVTQDTPSARELLQDGVNAILIDINDLEGSAQKIIDILDDDEKRKKIEKKALETYKKYLKPEIVVRELVEYIRNYS